MALAGHKNRNQMGTWIVGINPKGSAHFDGKLQVGDELLKFHKTVVRGRSHLNVSAIIKKAPINKKIRVIVLRGAESKKKAAVKKHTQFYERLDIDVRSPSHFWLTTRKIFDLNQTIGKFAVGWH